MMTSVASACLYNPNVTLTSRYFKLNNIHGYNDLLSTQILLHHVKLYDKHGNNIYYNVSADSELDLGWRLYQAQGLRDNQNLGTSDVPWCSESSNYHWLLFDLFNPVEIRSIELRAGNDGINTWGTLAPKSFDVQISTDGLVFDTMRTYNNIPNTRTDSLIGWSDGEIKLFEF